MGKWISRVVLTQIVDGITGEILKISKLEIKKKEYDIYMKNYIENMKLDKIAFNNTEYSVLLSLQLELKYSSSFIRICSSMIKDYAKELDLSKQSIYNAIDSLIEKKVLILVSEDTFHFNPVYYWNGPECERILELKMINEKLIQLERSKKHE